MAHSAILPNGISEDEGDKDHGRHSDNDNVILMAGKVGRDDGLARNVELCRWTLQSY